MTETRLGHKEFSRRGGLSTFKKYGRGFYGQIGKKGAASKIKKYGSDYFKKLSVLGVAARKAKKEANSTS